MSETKPKKKWDFWGLVKAAGTAAMSDEPEKELRALADDVTKDVHDGLQEQKRKDAGIIDTTGEEQSTHKGPA